MDSSTHFGSLGSVAGSVAPGAAVLAFAVAVYAGTEAGDEAGASQSSDNAPSDAKDKQNRRATAEYNSKFVAAAVAASPAPPPAPYAPPAPQPFYGAPHPLITVHVRESELEMYTTAVTMDMRDISSERDLATLSMAWEAFKMLAAGVNDSDTYDPQDARMARVALEDIYKQIYCISRHPLY